MVGAVVVRDGAVVGEGFHRRAGGPHAEIAALAAAGGSAAGATVYVTLEPCSHHGRTPPCVDALLAAGVKRVVACHLDPDPRVRGAGLARLRDARIEVEVGPLAEEAARLNLSYLVSTVERRPAVTLKWAMSLDGRIATAAGESRWISSPAARRWALGERETHDATLVGVGTVLADDPLLTRRLGRAAGPNLRVVLDRRLRTPPRARLFSAPGEVLMYTESADATRAAALASATVVRLARVEPAAVVADLQARGVRSLLVEGGGEVHASFVAAGLYDRVAAVCAPLLLGGARAPGPLAGEGLGPLADAPRVGPLTARRLGPDYLLSGERLGCLPALLQSVGA